MPLEKILIFYFDLKHPKMTTAEGEGSEVAIALVLKPMYLFTSQNALLFLESALQVTASQWSMTVNK